MKHFRLLALILPLSAYLMLRSYSIQPQVLGVSTQNDTADFITQQTTISAKTAFKQKEITINQDIPFETEYKNDDTMEIGQEKILNSGINGVIKYKYLITYWFDDEMDRQLVGTETVQPQIQVVARGTKIVWRTLDTEIGKIKYWRKMRVWATKYDGNCFGCRGLTYSGTKVVKGVCAVDPKVISLGTNFYVVGYGMCRSEDIGGAIKGMRIDLGFVDASKAAWGAAYTDIYLMTSAPQQ